MKTILLTGGAGFIGSHLAAALLRDTDNRIICLDNFDPFYPPALKRENLEALQTNDRFRLWEADLATLTPTDLQQMSGGAAVDLIIHLAAKAGVRPSIQDPLAYYQTNTDGTLRLLEYARQAGIPRFIFASSSSVYGNAPRVPWTEDLRELMPISPYASSKLAGEQLGQVYSHLYGIRFTALRLFTVYGPRQRPDLAIHKFYNLMRDGREITVYGDGSTSRDYTFVGDIVAGILAAVNHPSPEAFSVFNLGNGHPVSLLQLVRALETVLGKPALLRHTGEQPGDVQRTWADIHKASEQLGYRPATSLEEGIRAFARWKETVTAIHY